MRPVKIPNRKIDLAAWFVVLLFLVAVPLLVPVIHPDAGKDAFHPNPTILIIFLGLLGLIVLTDLVVIFNWFKDRRSTSLSPGLGNSLNVLAKLIGALFIVSGFVKLQDIVGFSYKLNDYWDVWGMSFMKPMSVIMAAGVSVFEVGLALALMTAYKMRITGFFALFLILFFTGLTGYSAITGAVTDCGCFGDALKLTPWQSFTKDIFLTLAIIPLYLLRKRIQPWYRNPIPSMATFGSIAITGFISFYTWQHLPMIDFITAYKAGQNLEFNATTTGEDGTLIAHDFFEFCEECGMNGYKGATLYIVNYNMEKSPEHAMLAMRDLVNKLKTEAPGIKVCGGTNTISRIKEPLLEKYGLDMCFSSQDEKTLKTMLRSSPGYMLIKDGIVQQKWHYNDIPTVENLRSMVGPMADEKPSLPITEPMIPDSSATDTLAGDSLASAPVGA